MISGCSRCDWIIGLNKTTIINANREINIDIKRLNLTSAIPSSRVFATTIATSYLHAEKTPTKDDIVKKIVSKPKSDGEYILVRIMVRKKLIACATTEEDVSEKIFFANSVLTSDLNIFFLLG